VAPRCGVGVEAARAMPGRKSKTAQQMTTSRRCVVRQRAGPSTRARVGSFFIAISSERGCCLRRGSTGLTVLPAAVLLEELFLVLVGHRRTTGRAPVLVDEIGKHRLQVVRLGCIG